MKGKTPDKVKFRYSHMLSLHSELSYSKFNHCQESKNSAFHDGTPGIILDRLR